MMVRKTTETSDKGKPKNFRLPYTLDCLPANALTRVFEASSEKKVSPFRWMSRGGGRHGPLFSKLLMLAGMTRVLEGLINELPLQEVLFPNHQQ